MYTGVFNLIILLADPPQSNCLSLGSSCLSMGLDKVLGFRFLIKASCSLKSWRKAGHNGLPFVPASPGTLRFCSLASCEPVAGAQPASSGSCCSLAACSWANQLQVNPIMARPWFRWRGGSGMAEEQGCPWAGGCLVWAAKQTLKSAKQGKMKGCAFQNELLLSSCLLWKSQCSLQPYFTFEKKEKKGLPGLLNVEYAALVGKGQEAQLLPC